MGEPQVSAQALAERAAAEQRMVYMVARGEWVAQQTHRTLHGRLAAWLFVVASPVGGQHGNGRLHVWVGDRLPDRRERRAIERQLRGPLPTRRYPAGYALPGEAPEWTGPGEAPPEVLTSGTGEVAVG